MRDDDTIRVGDKVAFSKTMLEMLLADVQDRPDFPEGAVTIVGEVIRVSRVNGGFVVPSFKRVT